MILVCLPLSLQKERLQRPARCPDQLWQLIEACWAQDPKDRPSFADTLQALQQYEQQLQPQPQAAPAQQDLGAAEQGPAGDTLQPAHGEQQLPLTPLLQQQPQLQQQILHPQQEQVQVQVQLQQAIVPGTRAVTG